MIQEVSLHLSPRSNLPYASISCPICRNTYTFSVTVGIKVRPACGCKVTYEVVNANKSKAQIDIDMVGVTAAGKLHIPSSNDSKTAADIEEEQLFMRLGIEPLGAVVIGRTHVHTVSTSTAVLNIYRIAEANLAACWEFQIGWTGEGKGERTVIKTKAGYLHRFYHTVELIISGLLKVENWI